MMKSKFLLLTVLVLWAASIMAQSFSADMNAYEDGNTMHYPEYMQVNIYRTGTDDISSVSIYMPSRSQQILLFSGPAVKNLYEGVMQFVLWEGNSYISITFVGTDSEWQLAGAFMDLKGIEFICLTSYQHFNTINTFR